MDNAHDDVVFRKPFDLRLEIDATQRYQEHFERVPYVFKDAVYLFKGDAFGVAVSIGPESVAVTFEPTAAKADIFFHFEQRSEGEGNRMMVLTVENRTSRTLTVETLMTVPGRKEVFYTRMLSVRPMRTNYEAWPHPIVQLVLRKLRLSDL